MAAGKNKVERWFLIQIDDSGTAPRDLTGDLIPGTITGGGRTLDEVEMTGVSDEYKNFLSGHANSEIGGQFYLNDTAVTGSFTVLNGIVGVVGTITMQFGAGAAPTTGDPEWEGEYICLAADIALAGNKPVVNARFLPSGSVAPAWGTVT